jgi:hypothetical protein
VPWITSGTEIDDSDGRSLLVDQQVVVLRRRESRVRSTSAGERAGRGLVDRRCPPAVRASSRRARDHRLRVRPVHLDDRGGRELALGEAAIGGPASGADQNERDDALRKSARRLRERAAAAADNLPRGSRGVEAATSA